MFANSLVPRRLNAQAAIGGEFDRLFGEMFGTPERRLSTYQSGDWQAQLGVWEKDDVLHLELEVPGVSKEDVEITAEDGVLKIAGERKSFEDAERTEHYSERRFGRFERVVRLPKQFDLDSVSAELADGVLHVSVSKTPESQPKRIDVK
ncbi:MAG: Hsp20/alpha crystallin family protein [Pirellulales bacterium]|nr:Hsp20/alpha crystallin family protein [Pirellulales bacterium]